RPVSAHVRIEFPARLLIRLGAGLSLHACSTSRAGVAKWPQYLSSHIVIFGSRITKSYFQSTCAAQRDATLEEAVTHLTNADIIQAYSGIPQDVIEAFGDQGDLVRQYLLNPTLFALLGDVRGTTILDAGCGQGY